MPEQWGPNFRPDICSKDSAGGGKAIELVNESHVTHVKKRVRYVRRTFRHCVREVPELVIRFELGNFP